MRVEEIAKQEGIQISAFCGDVATCCSNECDVIFISAELADRIKDRAKVPLVILNNFMDRTEVETKTIEYLNSLS